MILCVTPNPAIDRTLVVPRFEMGGVFRTEEAIMVAGGKGLNVARVAAALGAEVRCAGFVAGYAGRLFVALAEREGLAGEWTEIDGETRSCVIVADRSQRDVAVINERGPRVSADDWERFCGDVLRAAASAGTVCLCGSLPPGPSPEGYAALLQALVDAGKAVWVDTSGASLEAALGVPGIHVKVNHDEASALVGCAVGDVVSALDAAESIRRRTRGVVALTLGKSGAVMTTGAARYHARSPRVESISAVGSGDAFLAGLVTGFDTSPETGLAQAVAVGAANTLVYGGGRFAMGDYQRLLAAAQVEQVG